MTDWNIPPLDIERRSFEIIDAEAPAHAWTPAAWTVVRRMIHTSADFDYVASVRMHADALASGVQAIRQGLRIITDTRMAQAGITPRHLKGFGVETECLIDHPDVVERASKAGVTRAISAVDMALEGPTVGIYVIGNAPTALFRLMERISQGALAPKLIVGLPVGFVNAAESKQALLSCPSPFITNIGRKGGSNVAAAVVNAVAGLAREAADEQ